MAIISLRILLAVAAKFGFKTLQLDLVNAFIYANWDKTIFIRMFLEYVQSSKVLKLNKALYSLC